MDWVDSRTIRSGDTDFQIIEGLCEMLSVQSVDRHFLLAKTRKMIEWYMQLLDNMQRPNIFELGIFKGGSTAFFQALCQPRKLVAIEFENQRVAELDRFIRERDCADTLIPFYGVNQADDARLNMILKDEFDGQELDLVVDDASHFLKETRASFNVLFPRLRRGGLYIIEDWGWAHVPVEPVPNSRWPFKKRTGPWRDQPAMSPLIFEIIMASVSKAGIIDSVEIRDQMAVITRGESAVSEPFDISSCYVARGRSFKPGI